LNFCINSIHINYPLLGSTNSNITTADKNNVNNSIKDKVENWGTGGSGSVGDTYIEGDLTVENNY
ncbi:MAG: hypothetical protein ACRDA5_13745, partial [Clostridium sp.]